jgi:hypothetical protein
MEAENRKTIVQYDETETVISRKKGWCVKNLIVVLDGLYYGY